jgi:isoleucyl-tRNA synthetase
MYGRAPYRGLLTHGFTVDSQGHKMSKSLGNGIEPQEVNKKLGAEIVRLWVAASDYSGDIAGDDKILARVVDTYRRVRNTLKFLMANVSDFDPATDTVPLAQMVEIDRYALSRAAQLQADILAHYEVYEFHPVVAKLQIYCSEDLGAFYLDVLKDRLYTTQPKSLARRSAQTALWTITQAMVRWMAPFLSFTAEEAWAVMTQGGKVPAANAASIFLDTYLELGRPDEALLTKWGCIRIIRDAINKGIEEERAKGLIGSSLQATLELTGSHEDVELLTSLKQDLRFALIVSEILVHTDDRSSQIGMDEETAFSVAAGAFTLKVKPSPHQKCERCWHYVTDVGSHAAHPTLCGRCISNLHGAGETRSFA